MPNIMKSFLELGGDVVSTQVAGLGVLDAANSVLEGLGVSVDKVAGNLKTEEDYFITAEGELLDWRRTTLTGYVYITTTKAVTDCQEAIRKDPQYDPQRYEEYNYMDLLVQHSNTRKLVFRYLDNTEFAIPTNYFKRFVAVLYGESSRTDTREGQAIGCAIINAMRKHKQYYPNTSDLGRFEKFLTSGYTKAPSGANYIALMKLSLDTIMSGKSNKEMKGSFLEAIYALINYGLNDASDISNGATHWDGGDFIAKGTEHYRPKHVGIYISDPTHLTANADFWNTKRPNGLTELEHRIKKGLVVSPTLVSTNNQGNAVFALSPNPYKSVGDNNGLILVLSIAQYGGTIFWAPNYNEPINQNYAWKGLFYYP